MDDKLPFYHEKARYGCEACGRDRGTVWIIYEARNLCLECASIWREARQEKQDNEPKRTE